MKSRSILLESLLFMLLTSLLLATPAVGAPLPSEKERKMLALEAQVAALERKAYQLKQKIQSISDKVFKKKFDQGSPKLSVYHTNKMAGYFHIVSVTYSIKSGGKTRKLLSKTTTVKNKLPDQLKVYKGNVAKGRYTLTVKAKVRGYNPVLTYINNYKIDLGNKLPFRANPGRLTSIGVEFTDSRSKDISKRLKIVFRVTR